MGLVVGVIGGGVAVYLLKSSHEPGTPPPPHTAFAPVPGKEAGRLADRFRPLLEFDSHEKWRPISLDALFAERNPDGTPAQQFCERPPATQVGCQGVASVAAFEDDIASMSAVGSSTYLNLAGTKLSDYHAPDRDPACLRAGLFDCGDAPGSAIYYRVTSANQRFYIDYWWFFRYNHFPVASATCSVKTAVCDEHEGDWEGVTLVTKPNDRYHVDYVDYASHRGRFRYPLQQLLTDGRRPEVFVAYGSHASYPKPCSGVVCSQSNLAGGLAYLPETPTDGSRPWERNQDACPPGKPGSCLLPLPNPETHRNAWTAWPGLWGATCGARCGQSGPDSPSSPGTQPRFLTPWCSSLGQTPTCDGITQSCSDWLGPLVRAVACDTQALDAPSPPAPTPGGGLKLAVNSGGKVSATTPGVIQDLGRPLRPGAEVTVSGGGPATEVLVRAQADGRLLQARFDPFSARRSGGVFKVEISGQPRLRAIGVGPDGKSIPPVEVRRFRVRPRAGR